MHQFNEHRPELKGFSRYFAKEIFPLLSDREEARIAAVSKAKKYSLFVGLGVLGIYVLAAILGARFNAYLFATFGGFFTISTIFVWQLKSIKAFTKDKIVNGICSYVGWKFKVHPQAPRFSQWADLNLIPKGYDSSKRHSNKQAQFEDQITGQAHGAGFQSTEVVLTKESGDNDVTEFRGQLMSITFPRQFMGRTVVLRDKGFLQSKKKGDMKRVGLVDPVFEKLFEAYGTDQVEARYLLTPVFMQTLIDLENSIGGKNIRFGFDENQLFIAVETKNQFEAGSMFEPLTNPARTQKILDEIGAVYDVVDVVSRSKRG